jgi:hypothetical protein
MAKELCGFVVKIVWQRWESAREKNRVPFPISLETKRRRGTKKKMMTKNNVLMKET